MCKFEQDLCGWQVQNSGPEFATWQRKNFEELENEGLSHPANGDFLNDKKKYFMIANDIVQEEQPENTVTYLRSPDFLIEQHPKECFNFWFIFDTNGAGTMLELYLENTADNSQQLIWALQDTWSTQPDWIEGRLEVKGEEFTQTDPYRVIQKTDWYT